jgi:hypothetical protein
VASVLVQAFTDQGRCFGRLLTSPTINTLSTDRINSIDCNRFGQSPSFAGYHSLLFPAHALEHRQLLCISPKPSQSAAIEGNPFLFFSRLTVPALISF